MTAVRRGLALAVALGALAAAGIGAQPALALAWSGPVAVDQRPPFGQGPRLKSIECPSKSLCVALAEQDVLTSTHPAGDPATWRRVRTDAAGVMNDISCASKSFCVATSSSGEIVSSTDPTGGMSVL